MAVPELVVVTGAVGAFVVAGAVGALVVVVGALVVVVGALVVGTVLNSELSNLEVQPGSLGKSILPSRSLSRPSEHCGLGREVEVVDDTGSVEVVVEPSSNGKASGVSGEGSSAGVSSAGSGCERVATKIKNGIAASASSSATFTIGLRSLNDIEAWSPDVAISFRDTSTV